MKTKLPLIATLALTLCGCTSVSKAIIGLKNDHSAIDVDSNTLYGKNQIRRMNPGPGHSVFMHPDGTMEQRWVGTNATPQIPASALRGVQRPPAATIPFSVDVLVVPSPSAL